MDGCWCKDSSTADCSRKKLCLEGLVNAYTVPLVPRNNGGEGTRDAGTTETRSDGSQSPREVFKIGTVNYY